jgi:hypothetical protein
VEAPVSALSTDPENRMSVEAENRMIREEIAHRQRYSVSIANQVRAGLSIHTAGQGDCFIISLLFGISFAKGTQWLFQKLQPFLGEATGVTAANMLCVSSGVLEVHDEVVDKLRAALKSEIELIERLIRSKVEERTWRCDGELLVARNLEQSYYAEQRSELMASRSSRHNKNFEGILRGDDRPTVEFIDFLFNWGRTGNVNKDGNINVGSPRQYTMVKGKRTQKRAIFFPTCYNDIIILHILPKYGIYVNLIVDHVDMGDPVKFLFPADKLNLQENDVVDVILRYSQSSKNVGHYEPLCPEFLDLPSML